jgi:uncharacterized membrane protein
MRYGKLSRMLSDVGRNINRKILMEREIQIQQNIETTVIAQHQREFTNVIAIQYMHSQMENYFIS